jgi:hypothetical protein
MAIKNMVFIWERKRENWPNWFYETHIWLYNHIKIILVLEASGPMLQRF